MVSFCLITLHKYKVLLVADMYCSIAFEDLLVEDPDVELPAPVTACPLTGRPEKHSLVELEV